MMSVKCLKTSTIHSGTEMFTLVLATDLQTRQNRWVWNNRDENKIIILQTHQVQTFVDELYGIDHEVPRRLSRRNID